MQPANKLSAETHFQSGNKKSEFGDYKGAITDYDAAINLKPDFAYAYYNQGCAKDKLEQTCESEAEKAVVITKDRDFVHLLGRLGPPPQVVWVTCGNVPNTVMREMLHQHFPNAILRLQLVPHWYKSLISHNQSCIPLHFLWIPKCTDYRSNRNR